MGSSRGASVGVVSEGVDVHATLRVGILASNIVLDGGWAILSLLLEDESAGDGRVAANDANYQGDSLLVC